MDEATKAKRRLGITGTDAAAIVGISPWKSAADVWVEKLHPESVVKPSAEKLEEFEWGNRLERAVADRYADVYGQKVYKPGIMTHPNLPWLIGSPDFLVRELNYPNTERGLEVKTAKEWVRDEWGAPGTDMVPQHYLVQCQHYMMVTALVKWDVAVLIGGHDFRVYHLEADADLQGMLLEAEDKFWRDHVLGNKMPDPTGTKTFLAYLLSRFPRGAGEPKVLSPYDHQVSKAVEVLEKTRAVLKRAKATKETCEAILKTYMESAPVLKDEDGKTICTWKNDKDSDETDWQAFASDAFSLLPADKVKELLEKHTTKRPGTRVFRFKDSK